MLLINNSVAFMATGAGDRMTYFHFKSPPPPQKKSVSFSLSAGPAPRVGSRSALDLFFNSH